MDGNENHFPTLIIILILKVKHPYASHKTNYTHLVRHNQETALSTTLMLVRNSSYLQAHVSNIPTLHCISIQDNLLVGVRELPEGYENLKIVT